MSTDLDRTTIEDAVSILAHGSRECSAAERRMGRALDNDPTRSRHARTYANGRVEVDLRRRELYSYGRHFPLARFVPKQGRHGPIFVINGDDWPGPNSRTREHQAETRRAIDATGIDWLIVPFSALDGAGVDIDSIRIVHKRPDAHWTETVAVDTLDEVPHWRRTSTIDVKRTAETIEDVPADYREQWGDGLLGYARYPRRRDEASGLYTWRENETRKIQPDEDGRYRWKVDMHRLGDSLFSAVRDVREPRRPADPFERPAETTRETVSLLDSQGRTYCKSEASSEHEAGPSGACIHCREPLRADVVWNRRARYLSSFDTNENPPLYFLAEVPRGAGETVESALDSLAPRAVHAALARGMDVRRQGDVFLIRTALADSDLEARGIVSRARLTQWTRDARARKGEVGYSRPLTAAERRRMTALARRRFRELLREATRKATSHESAHCLPLTPKGSRVTWAGTRAEAASDLARAENELRRAIIGPLPSVYGPTERHWTYDTLTGRRRELSLADRRRAAHASRVKSLRERVETIKRRERAAYQGRVIQRDAYRKVYGTNARAAWVKAYHDARMRFEPFAVAGGQQWQERRERARAAVSIYGTAHTATEVVKVRGGAVYVRGTVRQLPELEPGRRGGVDHRPIVLHPGSWYLAVRNRVPRQTRRRRRQTAAGTNPASVGR